MIIHRTEPENRESIQRLGLIPQYRPKPSTCPTIEGYVSASRNYEYWSGRPRHGYDYWRITGVKTILCGARCSKNCRGAVLIKGSIPASQLQLVQKAMI